MTVLNAEYIDLRHDLLFRKTTVVYITLTKTIMIKDAFIEKKKFLSIILRYNNK